ncbi:MAG: glycosyltransferase family 2 protein [Acidibacillus sp.]|nr:glycosyltransferase family 2 protein [Acidibacillus sp.]
MYIPNVWIVIVNYKGLEDTQECLRSVERIDYEKYQVIVVDNESDDLTVAILEAEFPSVRVLRSQKNLGYSGGNNLGVQLALLEGAEFIWLLNNDTIVTPDALYSLIELSIKCPDKGFYGSFINYYDDKNMIWYGGGRFYRRIGYIMHDNYQKMMDSLLEIQEYTVTQWITGCSMLVRRDVCINYGLLDESLFLYEEELDWQLRASNGNPSAAIVTRPLVYHKISASTNREKQRVDLGASFTSRNRWRIANSFAGIYYIVWITTWFLQYVMKPLLCGRINYSYSAIIGAIHHRDSAEDFLGRVHRK